jgi:methylaspartate ammonia-lyase
MAVSGIGQLLKALGIDPEEITRTIENAKQDIPEFAKKIDARVDAIEKKLDKILSILEVARILTVIDSEEKVDAGNSGGKSGDGNGGNAGTVGN